MREQGLYIFISIIRLALLYGPSGRHTGAVSARCQSFSWISYRTEGYREIGSSDASCYQQVYCSGGKDCNVADRLIENWRVIVLHNYYLGVIPVQFKSLYVKNGIPALIRSCR